MALYDSSVALCVTKGIRTDTELHRGAQGCTEKKAIKSGLIQI